MKFAREFGGAHIERVQFFGEMFARVNGNGFNRLRQAGITVQEGVLRQEAEMRGLVLGDEVMSYMLNRFSRDLGSLMQLIDHLDHFALQTQRALTIPLVRAMLENA